MGMCNDFVRIMSGLLRLYQNCLSSVSGLYQHCVRTESGLGPDCVRIVSVLCDFMKLLLDWGNMEFGTH